MNQYVKSFLYGISLGTVIIAILGAVFEFRELWATVLFLVGAVLLAWVTYKSGTNK
jgi:hypothetical protein